MEKTILIPSMRILNFVKIFCRLNFREHLFFNYIKSLQGSLKIIMACQVIFHFKNINRLTS